MQTITAVRSTFAASKIFRILFGVFILAVSAQLTIPWSPVPLTFQAATMLLLALTFSKNESLLIVMNYLLIGSIGAPIFAGFHGGLQVILGSNGGYLLGFIPATFITALLAEKLPSSIISYFIAILLGSITLFITGWLQLSYYLSFAAAYHFGVQPFLLIEPIKLVFVALIARRIRQ